MAHGGAKRNPYAPVWAEAAATVRALIAEVHQLGVELDNSRRHLNWRGGAERHFQVQVARQHHYLHRNNDLLRELLALANQAHDLPPASTPHTSTSGGAGL